MLLGAVFFESKSADLNLNILHDVRDCPDLEGVSPMFSLVKREMDELFGSLSQGENPWASPLWRESSILPLINVRDSLTVTLLKESKKASRRIRVSYE